MKSTRGNEKKDIYMVLGNALTALTVFVYFVLIPLYYKNGFEKIATRKYKLMMEASVVIAVLAVLYFLVLILLRGISYKDIKKYKSVMYIDLSILAYVLFAVISYGFSLYKKCSEKDSYWFYEGAFYGTSGWYMGLAMIIVMAAMYLIVSRNYSYNEKIFIPVIAVSTLIFLWSILNRFEIYPIEMKLQTEKFLASVGNINWLAGYSTITMPILIGLYWKNKSPKLEKILIAPLLITLQMVLLNGSDSLVISFVVMMVVLFVISAKEQELLLKFFEILIWFTFGGACISFSDMFYPITRTDYSELGKIFDGGVWSVVWFFFAFALYLYMYGCCNGKCKYPEWCRKNLGKVLGYSFLGFVGLFVLLLIVNTKSGNTIPVLKNIGFFYFDYEWGTRRGAIFYEAYRTFKDELWWQKIIGVGPDSFYFQLVRTPSAMRIHEYIFQESRLTNAHCEFFTILINNGILGVISWAAIMIMSLKEFIKRSRLDKGYVIFVLIIVMYLSNNIISFQQIMNTPLLFVALGLGVSKIVSENR